MCGPKSVTSRLAVETAHLSSRPGPVLRLAAFGGDLLRVPFDDPPSSAISATWDREERTLLLADYKKREIRSYDLRGHLDQRLSFTSGSPPMFIARDGDGYILKDAYFSLAWLNSDLTASQGHKPGDFRSGASAALDVIWNWLPLNDNLLLFGDIKKDKDHFVSAIVRMQRSEDGCFESMQTMSKDDPARTFFLLGFQYLAGLNNRGYVLVMDKTPYIVEVGLGARKLGAFPTGFRGRPSLPLPSDISKKTLPSAYETLVKSKVAAGLVAWKNHLYLFAREPLPGRGTRWTLWLVDPLRDSVARTPIVLPTNAEHIIVIPGETRWAIIEKGPYRGLGTQEIIGMAVVKATTLLGGPDTRASMRGFLPRSPSPAASLKLRSRTEQSAYTLVAP
jgi:hypothetical protein